MRQASRRFQGQLSWVPTRKEAGVMRVALLHHLPDYQQPDGADERQQEARSMEDRAIHTASSTVILINKLN